MVNEGAEKLSGDSIQGHDRLLPVRIEPKARKTLSRSDRDCQGDGELGPPVTWASPSFIRTLFDMAVVWDDRWTSFNL